METQQHRDYHRIEKAIEFFRSDFMNQPSLEEAAEQVHLSPFHFQRMFREWAGVTPKQFLHYLSVEHARSVLKKPGVTLSDTAFETGLSGTGRLHDLFVKIEAMTPGAYKNGGENLSIRYRFSGSPFGPVLIASTDIGVCHLSFVDGEKEGALAELRSLFPKAGYREGTDGIQQNALRIFQHDWTKLDEIKLHLKGTPFRIKVWEALLKVPAGGLTTYSGLAGRTDHPLACRAVGTAVGSNPIAYLIPCHRVIRSTGETGQYRWGAGRKQAIIGWEASRNAASPSP